MKKDVVWNYGQKGMHIGTYVVSVGIYVFLLLHFGGLLLATFTDIYLDGICFKCLPDSLEQKIGYTAGFVFLLISFVYANYRLIKHQKYVLYALVLPLLCFCLLWFLYN